uniref:Putative ovule protein n=1 Tax=Solanum chacoense TaxID=4108 RepID=A0A0V0HW04_SOLCH
MYLALAEWWYNSTFHSAIQTSPYEALYGQPPPNHLPYLPGEAVDEEVDRSLITREFKTQLLKFHLARAQQRMSDLANK